MTATANDLLSAGAPGCDWKMTVFELAIFMCLYRAGQPRRVEDICKVIGGWFECVVDPPAAAAPIEHMLANRWVAEKAMACAQPRTAAVRRDR